LLAFVHEPQIDNPAIELIPDGGAYLLKNLTDTVQPVVIRYPYLTTFNDAVAMPYVMRDRYSEEDIDAMIFSHALGREQMELTDDGWNIANLDGEPDLSAPTHYPMDTPIGVYVLTGTNPTGLDESFTVKFTADEDIDVFTFGFNGWTKHENTYTLSRNDDGDMTAYIALIGGDVRNWEDSQIGVSRDEKPFHDYRVTLYEMTLDEFVKTVIKADNARLDDPTDSTVYLYEAEPYLYRQAVIDWMYSYTALSEENAPRYETGRMETIIADVRLVPRIMVMQCSTTVPAGATDRFTIENGGLAG